MAELRDTNKTRPFSIRLTTQERETLEALSGGRPIGAYVKSVLFADKRVPYRQSPRSGAKDQQALGRLLLALGASRMASNFNQIAKAANQGALPVTVELEADLKAACDHIADMRAQLLAALGITATDRPSRPSLEETFNHAAGGGR